MNNLTSKTLTIGIAVFVLLLAINSALFTVPEASQAVITTQGNPVRTVTEAGINWKIPFFQDVKLIDARLLSWDGDADQLTTKDKKYIYVDVTARWSIGNALVFMQSLQTEQEAYTRINKIIDSATRDIVASNNLVETVRNSNAIIHKIEEMKKLKAEKPETVDEEVYSEIEPIVHGRDKLAHMIKEAAIDELKAVGIKLIDVQIRRIAYRDEIQQKVYERMISERNRVAEKIRSIGQGESAKISGRMQKELSKIKSESYKTVQETKGAADAIALKTYAQVFSKNPELYEFLKSMEGYKEIFANGEKELVISPDTDYFKYLKGTGK